MIGYFERRRIILVDVVDDNFDWFFFFNGFVRFGDSDVIFEGENLIIKIILE